MRTLALLAMLLLVPVAVATAAVASGGDPIPGAGGTVWVTERTPGSSSVAAFDAATGALLGWTPVGSAPIGVVVPHGSAYAYSSDEAADQLSVISRDEIRVVATIPMGTGSRPHHLMASPNGRLIYVAEYNHNVVGVVDTARNANVEDIVASRDALAKTHAVWITGDGKALYATNEGATQSSGGTLSKLDARTGELLWEIPIGVRPSEVLVTKDGRTAYVSVRNENAVRVVDVGGDEPALGPLVAIGTQPDTLQLSEDGGTLAVGLRGTPQLAFMDTATLAVRKVTVAGHGISGHEWLSANGKFAFVALESPGSVATVDTETGEVLRDTPYPTGLLRPHGVFYEPRVLR
jgi:DNA-binding beta-propeller fold protein YncE